MYKKSYYKNLCIKYGGVDYHLPYERITLPQDLHQLRSTKYMQVQSILSDDILKTLCTELDYILSSSILNLRNHDLRSMRDFITALLDGLQLHNKSYLINKFAKLIQDEIKGDYSIQYVDIIGNILREISKILPEIIDENFIRDITSLIRKDLDRYLYLDHILLISKLCYIIKIIIVLKNLRIFTITRIFSFQNDKLGFLLTAGDVKFAVKFMLPSNIEKELKGCQILGKDTALTYVHCRAKSENGMGILFFEQYDEDISDCLPFVECTLYRYKCFLSLLKFNRHLSIHGHPHFGNFGLNKQTGDSLLFDFDKAIFYTSQNISTRYFREMLTQDFHSFLDALRTNIVNYILTILGHRIGEEVMPTGLFEKLNNLLLQLMDAFKENYWYLNVEFKSSIYKRELYGLYLTFFESIYNHPLFDEQYTRWRISRITNYKSYPALEGQNYDSIISTYGTIDQFIKTHGENYQRLNKSFLRQDKRTEITTLIESIKIHPYFEKEFHSLIRDIHNFVLDKVKIILICSLVLHFAHNNFDTETSSDIERIVFLREDGRIRYNHPFDTPIKVGSREQRTLIMNEQQFQHIFQIPDEISDAIPQFFEWVTS